MAGALIAAVAAARPAVLTNFLRFIVFLPFVVLFGAGPAPSISVATVAVAVVAAGMVTVERQVHCRILGEKAVRLQREADVLDRHHREVLGPADMRCTKTVPEHDVLVLDRAVVRDVSGQAVAAGMLVGKLAAGVALL